MARIVGTNSDDQLFGREGRERLAGLRGDDLLAGGGGDDTLIGGAGDDTLIGGAGNDTVLLGGGTDAVDIARAGLGDDTYDFSGVDISSFVLLDYSGLAAALRIDVSGGSVDKGSSGVDTLLNLADVNFGLTITDGIGADNVTLGRGIGRGVTFVAGAGADTIRGGDGFDRLIFSNEADGVRITVVRSVDGLMAGRAVDAFGFTDRFFDIDEVGGTQWNDRIRGSSGDDRISADEGHDVLDGRGGFDVLRYDRPAILSIDADLSAARVTKVSESGVFVDVVRRFEDIQGSTGDDRIVGRSVDERFDGSQGNDYLHGGAGDDTLIGGRGDDTLIGGTGADTFVFDGADGADRIASFLTGRDKIEILDGADSFADLSITTTGSGATIAFADTTIFVVRVVGGEIGEGDFLFA